MWTCPAGGRSNILSLKYWAPWEGLQGRGLGRRALQSWLPLVSWLWSLGDNGSHTLLRPMLLLIHTDGMPLTDCATVFVGTGFDHLHAHLFLRISRSTVIRMHCFHGTCWQTSFPLSRNTTSFGASNMKAVFCSSVKKKKINLSFFKCSDSYPSLLVQEKAGCAAVFHPTVEREISEYCQSQPFSKKAGYYSQGNETLNMC